MNSLVKPIAKLLSLPMILLTLGGFLLVVNAVMLLLTARFASLFGFEFRVAGFGPALLGALVVSVVSVALAAIFRSDD